MILAFLAPVLAVLGPIWSFSTSRVGLPLVVAGGIVFFYEGVPIGPLRYIPYAGPVLASLVDGRVDREYAAGQKAEAALWQERLRLAAIAQAADTKTRQQDIDAAAQEYIDRQHSDAGRIAELQRAHKDEDNVPPDPTKPAVCRPAGISAGVSTRLDAIGR
ncbi:hypothetical protein [Mesorhizobium sp. NZP2077]|uniref:hypothetical protein n=1 Tax=Mesorhizobium sp. NZP2077 TaxID=2483404 RepID=UPI001553BD28|nr:hypothetical protein [Mesorhizobium sp. NZP2077]QKC83289.1 hypothetical protein EB232_18180 [Mesorhizobium sp. NZP2077]QKD16806.1 hypothetical protein HGP13_17965 [Mesorhizobium sp. NZP2077]